MTTIIGPYSYCTEAMGYYTLGTMNLDSATDATACHFILPKSGTITKVGLWVTNITGDPPAYKIGLCTVVGTTAAVNKTAYGSSSIEVNDFTSTGWHWITLGTPATAVVGEQAAVHIFAGDTAPDASNYIKVHNSELFYYVTPYGVYTTSGTSWSSQWGPTAMAIQYSDGDIYGFPIVGCTIFEMTSATSPDEMGCRFSLALGGTCIGAVVFIADAYGAGSTLKVTLYDMSDNVLAETGTYDMATLEQSYVGVQVYFSEVELDADVDYRLTVTAMSTNNIMLSDYVFASATDRATKTYSESDRWYKTSRTDEGSWTDDNTSIVHMGLIFSELYGGTSGSTGGNIGATGYYGFIG